ncbi:MAG: hypothetical protein L0Y72_00070 [Gemmataceae bacterium]|nr:hypothetical protein [Gemmataceae bacterium]MCI0737405.1 hypothetical protein [Gemmataceae bacterium]
MLNTVGRQILVLALWGIGLPLVLVAEVRASRCSPHRLGCSCAENDPGFEKDLTAALENEKDAKIPLHAEIGLRKYRDAGLT